MKKKKPIIWWALKSPHGKLMLEYLGHSKKKVEENYYFIEGYSLFICTGHTFCRVKIEEVK